MLLEARLRRLLLRDKLDSSDETFVFWIASTIAVIGAGSFSGGEARHLSRGFIFPHVLPSKTTPFLVVGIGIPSDDEDDHEGDLTLGETPLERCFVRRL